MAKKSNKTESAEKVASEKLEVCQFCKNHCNKPSWCKVNKKYVARKATACDKFKKGDK